jgi:hypothetical protein
MLKIVGTVIAVIAAVGLLGAGTANAAGHGTTCTGELAPGHYTSVVVPDGAFCHSDGLITVNGGIQVGEGATLVLGSEENPTTTAIINGGVHSTNAASVQIHFSIINGGVNLQGGSGPLGGPFGITWNTIEDSQINGHVTINGYNGFWMGFIRNTVNGGVELTNNVLVDEDGNEYVTNHIVGGLSCSGNSPAPQIGDSEGSANVVIGPKTGQCAGL